MRLSTALPFAAAAALSLVGLTTATPIHGAAVRLAARSPAKSVWGVAYSPFRKSAEPNVAEDMAIIQRYTSRVRLYGMDGRVLDDALNAVSGRPDGEIYAGMFFDASEASYRNQLDSLLAAAQRNRALFTAKVKAVIVGNEAILNGIASEATTLARIQEVRGQLRAAGFSVPVTTAEPMVNYSPALASAVDVLMPTLHPYFDGVAIDGAVAKVFQLMDMVKQRDSTGKKELIIGEVGWPYQGKPNRDSVPSMSNAVRFFNEFTAAAAERNIKYFYFEAFDQSWKTAGPLGVEPHWGLYTGTRVAQLAV